MSFGHERRRKGDTEKRLFEPNLEDEEVVKGQVGELMGDYVGSCVRYFTSWTKSRICTPNVLLVSTSVA